MKFSHYFDPYSQVRQQQLHTQLYGPYGIYATNEKQLQQQQQLHPALTPFRPSRPTNSRRRVHIALCVLVLVAIFWTVYHLRMKGGPKFLPFSYGLMKEGENLEMTVGDSIGLS